MTHSFGIPTSRGRKVYLVAYRPNGAGRKATKRRYTIAEHGKLTPEKARGEAERLLFGVKLGADPAGAKAARKRENTMGELCDRYLGARRTAQQSEHGSRNTSHCRKPDGQPVQRRETVPEKKRERFYSDTDLQRIGAALAEMERENAIFPACALAVGSWH